LGSGAVDKLDTAGMTVKFDTVAARWKSGKIAGKSIQRSTRS
jgi:hypothetical protein